METAEELEDPADLPEEIEKEEEKPRRGRPPKILVEEEPSTTTAAPFIVDRLKLESDLKSFDFPGRGAVDIDKEINQRNVLYGTVSKLKYSNEAQVSIERLLPETWEGVSG